MKEILTICRWVSSRGFRLSRGLPQAMVGGGTTIGTTGDMTGGTTGMTVDMTEDTIAMIGITVAEREVSWFPTAIQLEGPLVNALPEILLCAESFCRLVRSNFHC